MAGPGSWLPDMCPDACRPRVPASVDQAENANLIDAARVRATFVLVSVVGASPGHPISLFRAKHAASSRRPGEEDVFRFVVERAQIGDRQERPGREVEGPREISVKPCPTCRARKVQVTYISLRWLG